MKDFFNSHDRIQTSTGNYSIYRIDRLESAGIGTLARLPYSIRVMLESVLRNCDDVQVKRQAVIDLANWKSQDSDRPVIPFKPSRVLMQDFTGVPALVDLASMRSALKRLGADPQKINPAVPVDLVIDHSIQVDYYAKSDALARNVKLEFERNLERYKFLHWGQSAFDNLRVVPPSNGIIHQVNLEYLSNVVLTKQVDGEELVYPDSLVGTDSHTTMINGLGVVGWGVGGIEAVAAMLDQPLELSIPDVIGFKLNGQLPEGTTPTDLTLTITQKLRAHGVVGKFIEFFGEGASGLSLADRAMISNMTPENGATMTFFPVDDQTIQYLRLTGRSESLIELVETYTKTQHLFRETGSPDPEYTEVIEMDLSEVEPSVSGPRRPQDRVSLRNMKELFGKSLGRSKRESGFNVPTNELNKRVTLHLKGTTSELKHGAVVVAAITSCTNTSNPYVMIGAGLLARNAVEKGLKTKPYVKTSLAPGSRVVSDYLEKAGLLSSLDELGFNVVGYGCTTCIGNTGPLDQEIVEAIEKSDLVAASVLSGNRNFEGRVSPYTQANYLASPPLVVAYAIAGTVNIDLYHDPLGYDEMGEPVFLKDIWPSSHEIMEIVADKLTPDLFSNSYQNVFSGNEIWNQIKSTDEKLFDWPEDSTYIQEPPYFEKLTADPEKVKNITGARVLAVLGESITTDHISPAGTIPVNSPAGEYLLEKGVSVNEFNSFGSRRGNDRVMTRGTFGNIRLKNFLLPGVEGGYTLHFPDLTKMTIYEAAMAYRKEEIPLLILAGKEYGSGSSRDWAAKGTMLLGVKAVIAESYERIHRSNLIGMGVLPLQFKPGQNIEELGLTGYEIFSIEGIDEINYPCGELKVSAVNESVGKVDFSVICRLDTEIEVEYYRNGGILNTYLYSVLNG